MLQIKDLKVLNLDPTLIKICEDLMLLGYDTITSAFRPGDAGVHGTLRLRGIDWRCHDEAKGKQAEEYINSKWVYDPQRPKMQVALYHDAGNGYHIHLQCHHNTRKR